MTDSILLIHDDPAALRTIGARFEQAGCEVLRELNGEAAAATLARVHPDVVCVAIHLAESSAAMLQRLTGQEALVIAFGGQISSVGSAEVMAAGASRVVETESGLEVLLSVAQRGAAEGRRRRVADLIFRAGSPRYGADSLGSSTAMRQLANQIGLLAQSERTTLLLTGETGIGKGWAARVIHDLGVRAGRPFFQVRLGGANPTYLESLVFGHEKGAFVEANERRRGLIELADGGTLLLRDINELPAELQPKLLRVLETRSFRRLVGSGRHAQRLRESDIRTRAQSSGRVGFPFPRQVVVLASALAE